MPSASPLLSTSSHGAAQQLARERGSPRGRGVRGGRWRDRGHSRPNLLTLVARRRAASPRLGLPSGRRGPGAGKAAAAGPERGRVRAARGREDGGARSRGAGQRRAMSQRGRREARGARWPGRGGAAFPAAAALAWAARGAGCGARSGAGREPRAAAARGARPGRAGEAVSAPPGAPVAKPPLPAPARGALLCLSLLLTLSLPGWKFPLTSREQTDGRTHARTPRGREVGSPPGVGKARASGAPCAPGPAPSWAPLPPGAAGRRPGSARPAAGTPGAPRSPVSRTALPEPRGQERTGTPPEAPAGSGPPGLRAARRRRRAARSGGPGPLGRGCWLGLAPGMLCRNINRISVSPLNCLSCTQIFTDDTEMSVSYLTSVQGSVNIYWVLVRS